VTFSSLVLDTVAVLGRVGKTSVAHTLAQALDVDARCAFVATIGSGFPDAYRAAAGAEPALGGAALLQRLDELSEGGAQAVAIETAFADHAPGGADLSFTHAVLTSVAGADPEEGDGVAADGEVAAQTIAFFQRPGLRWAVINLDDPGAAALLECLPDSVAIAGYGLSADTVAAGRCALVVRAERLDAVARGWRLDVRCHGVDPVWSGCALELEVALIGSFNAANALAVLTVLLVRGASPERAARDLARVRGVPGRMECFGDDGSPMIVVDAARSPRTLERVLRGLREHGPRRVLTVFGCRGAGAREIRMRMGSVASQWSDTLILTDDDPGTEPGEAIIADLLAGVGGCAEVRIQRRRDLAIRTALVLAGIDDAVLVAGKGEATTQDLGDTPVRFSDRAAVLEALRQWREGRH
jgi:UDP-N-acetylmuramoyl-L-alanyl-D-glutamate--2,6-diaminopimelate ligase